MEAERLMILYEDNSVEVHYSDGSRMLLSPCGTEFLYEKALSASSHPLQPPERVRQRTQFAISIYRQQLLKAVDFRNQYSDNLFLPSDIIPCERKKILFTDISEAQWPSPQDLYRTACLYNGAVKVTSSDGHACLSLPELHQDFTVEFLCKVSQRLPALAASLQKRCNKSIPDKCETSGTVLKPSSKQLRTNENNDCLYKTMSAKYIMQENNSGAPQEDVEDTWSFQNCSFEYCRVTQHMSVSSCPEEWKYALSLAFMFYQLHTDNKDKPGEYKDREKLDLAIPNKHETSRAATCLPQALPLSCHAPYLHRWSFSDFFQQQKEGTRCFMYSQPIKVVWCKGVIYRFFLEMSCIEIYPGDGSVFRSEGSFWGKYFTRYCIQKRTRHREETMYSVSSLPPDTPGSSYSVWAIISEAIRILQHNLGNMLSLTHNYNICCWKMASSERSSKVLPIPVAEKIIPNVGRFFAYSDGKVHAIFNDGIALNMMWDFSPCSGKSQGTEDFKTGWFKLTSPEGAYQLLEMDHPGLYERYIMTVAEWCKSLQKDQDLCADPLPTVPEENWSVAAELEKIKRFNFLVENSNIPCKGSAVEKVPSSSTDQQNSTPGMFLDESMSKKNIAETLEKTSKAISDIDTLLTCSLKLNTVRNISSNAVPH